MKREKIIKIIKKHVVDNLDDVEINDIDESESIKDLGASSLDIIEVISGSMRELKIKIPRSELAEISTINQLAEKFMQYKK
ncbi:MAG: acyl carrier protein [Planctomycetes bacterium]|nr:acyl carrier protein [Planctomycetota bacterium]